MMSLSRKTIAIPPGDTIKEQIIDRGISQKEFAARMNMSEKHISQLINGDVQLTQDVANRLEMVLGIPAYFWNNLEAIYRAAIVKVKNENTMDDDIKLLKKLPYNEMSKLNWVPKASKSVDKVMNLRKYFEVVELGLLTNSLIDKIACRRLEETEKGDFALMAWAQKAKLEARAVETSPIDLKSLKKAIPDIREMTTAKPDFFCSQLSNLLADCGIAIIFLPHIGGSFLHGATFHDGKKIVLGLTVRGKDADRFWFSLFHELGHILLGHINKREPLTKDEEAEADKFARTSLIPEDQLINFIKANDFSKDSIKAFAESINIDPGIVVGRLQKQGLIKYSWHNDLKTKYCISP